MTDWADYESGPFCRHWAEVGSCDESCASCGHSCNRHDIGDTTECNEWECDCKEWVDGDSPDTLKAKATEAFNE